MGVIIRGAKNAFRNRIRTGSIIFILAITIGLALTMLTSMRAVETKIASVKSSIGNNITVSPAGVRGFEGGGILLTEDNATEIGKISNVSKVTETLNDRLTTDTNTSLSPSLEAGSFGRRRAEQENGIGNQNVPAGNENIPQANFKMPINVTGINDPSMTQALNINELKLTSGAAFVAGSNESVALIGKDLATKNSLSVNSTFTVYGKTIKVMGIFDSGNTFSDSSLIMPIATLQSVSGQTDSINNLIIQVDSIDNVNSVQSAIESKLGDKVDVVSSQEVSDETIKPLESIKNISLYSLIGSLAAGSVIIFLTMIMIVRERRREIGVLKAIGASNLKINIQFIVESMVLSFFGSILGIIIGFAFANSVTKALVASTSSASAQGGPGNMVQGGGRMIARVGGMIPGAENTIRNIQATVGFDLILYGLGATILIAILGTAIPAFFISKIRPAEVMRSE